MGHHEAPSQLYATKRNGEVAAPYKTVFVLVLFRADFSDHFPFLHHLYIFASLWIIIEPLEITASINYLNNVHHINNTTTVM
jgi:hypothetical protein